MNSHTKPARLTQAFISSIEANGAKQRFSDHKVAGLCLRVAPGGTKTFVIRYRKPDNASAEMNIGRADVVTLEMARDRAKKHLAQVPDGHDPIEARRQAGIEARNKKMETLDALAGAYKASPGFLSKRIRTQEFYDSCMRVHILPRLGSRSVKEIGRKDIAAFLDQIYSEHSGPASNSARRTLSVLFSYATELELIDFNPVSAVKQRHRGGQRTRQLNDTELKRLWQALDNLEGVTSDVSDMIRLCLFLPARVNEIAGMEWAELNFNERLWTVRADRMKNNKPHELPFGEFGRKLLEKRRNSEAGNNPWVFPAKSGIEPMNGKVASRACNRLSRVWGWQPFGPHALRRGFTTRMAEKGVRLEILERALSHDVTGGRAIAHYDHYSYRDEKRDLMEHWEKTLLRIVQGQDSESDQDVDDE